MEEDRVSCVTTRNVQRTEEYYTGEKRDNLILAS